MNKTKPIVIAANAKIDPIEISTCLQIITIIWPIAITKIRGIAKKTALQLSMVKNRESIIEAVIITIIIIEKIPSSLILKNLSKILMCLLQISL